MVFALVQAAATISPGPAFIAAVRSSISYDRKTGIAVAFGLGAGVGVHVLFVLAGISLIIKQSVYLFGFIRLVGAIYLISVGIKALFFSKKSSPSSNVSNQELVQPLAAQNRNFIGAFLHGVLTNLLNPKAIIFFTAVYTQFVGLDTPLDTQLLYGLISVLIETLWFCFVVVVLTEPRIKDRFLRIVHWIEYTCGGLMIGLGLKLALSK